MTATVRSMTRGPNNDRFNNAVEGLLGSTLDLMPPSAELREDGRVVFTALYVPDMESGVALIGQPYRRVRGGDRGRQALRRKFPRGLRWGDRSVPGQCCFRELVPREIIGKPSVTRRRIPGGVERRSYDGRRGGPRRRSVGSTR